MNTRGNQNRSNRRIVVLLCISLIGSLLLPMGAFAAGQSLAPEKGDIVITNNSGKSDTIYVGGVVPGEIVTIYTAQGKKLGSKKVGSKKMDVSFTFSQLGANGGTLYVSVTSPSMAESDKTLVDIPAETSSDAIENVDAQVTITNNSGSADTIEVTGLEPKDVVRVYNAATGGKLLKSGTVSSSRQEITLKVSQLGAADGSVFISVANSGKRESARVEARYDAEGQTPMLESGDVDVINNVTGKKDHVHVTGLEKGDIITVYNEQGKSLAKSTCNNSSGEITIQLTQLGQGEGAVSITRKAKGLLESPKLVVDYDAEGNSQSLTESNLITVTNNASGMSDTIFVSNLEEGDTITVYKTETKTTTWGKATVAAGKDNVTISVKQLGEAAGSVWISRTMTGANESARIEAAYEAEGSSNEIQKEQVTIINNANTSDVIYVKGLSQSDKVNVYKDAAKRTLLGSATASADNAVVTITVAQLGTVGGSVYLSLTENAKKESGLTEKEYLAEEVSTGIDIDLTEVTVTNNAGIADTVEVSGLISGDVVKVYRDIDCNELLGKGSTVSGGVQVISIAQLGTGAGEIYLTLTQTNKVESKPSGTVGYEAEVQSKKIDEITGYQINIVNKTGTSSTLTVRGLEAYTTVKVYDKTGGGTLLGSGITDAYGGTLVVSLSALPQGAGDVYVSLTTVGKLESDRVKIAHGSKLVTAAPEKEDVEVVNNAGIADTITVNNLSAGDVVKIYEEDSLVSTVLGSATVANGGMNAVVSISQLGKNGGTIYISATAAGKLESGLTEIAFLKETDSKAPNAGNIAILNYVGADDEIAVSGLSSGDVVKVYYTSEGGTAIGTATVNQQGSSVTVYVADLGAADGVVYVSVKSTGKNESARTEAKYVGESKAPAENAVIVTNNPAEEYDQITVKGLKTNDIVKVYSAATGGRLLGLAYADASGTVVIQVEQLTVEAGSIYVSVKNDGKCESARVEVNYSAEL